LGSVAQAALSSVHGTSPSSSYRGSAPNNGRDFVSAGTMLPNNNRSRRNLPDIQNNFGPATAASRQKSRTTTTTTHINTLPSSSTAAAAVSSKPTAPRRKPGPFEGVCYNELVKARQELGARIDYRQVGNLVSNNGLKQVVSTYYSIYINYVGCTYKIYILFYYKAKDFPLTDREFVLCSQMKQDLYEKFGKPFLEISKKYSELTKARQAESIP
jgi:hypothetical protein